MHSMWCSLGYWISLYLHYLTFDFYADASPPNFSHLDSYLSPTVHMSCLENTSRSLGFPKSFSLGHILNWAWKTSCVEVYTSRILGTLILPMHPHLNLNPKYFLFTTQFVSLFLVNRPKGASRWNFKNQWRRTIADVPCGGKWEVEADAVTLTHSYYYDHPLFLARNYYD